MATPSGLNHFSRLNPNVYLHEPTIAPSPNEPNLVLLIGWMDAQPRHLAKYTAKYESLYPSSRIIVITTSQIDTAWRTTAANIQRISPAMEVIYALPPDAKFLLHFASNGGGFTTLLVAKTYREKMRKPLPVSAMVMDSTPGVVRLKGTVKAFALIFPKNIILQFLTKAIFLMFYGLFMGGYWLVGKPNLVDIVRKALNNGEFFSRKVPRVYIYSEGDELVSRKDVEEHADKAEVLGYPVWREDFGGSKHCAHMLEDEGRYWGIVRKLWSGI